MLPLIFLKSSYKTTPPAVATFNDRSVPTIGMRTRVSRYMGAQDGGFEVDDAERVPEAGAFVLLDREWMEVVSALGKSVNVRRAQRGTQASAHDVGALVHYGKTVVREVPIAVSQEDWDL